MTIIVYQESRSNADACIQRVTNVTTFKKVRSSIIVKGDGYLGDDTEHYFDLDYTAKVEIIP